MTRFGWCISTTAQHTLCHHIATTSTGVVLTCECECHQEDA